MPRATTRSKRPAEPAATEPPNGAVLTLTEVAAYLRMPEEKVQRLACEGNLPGRWAGDEWRFLKSAVEDWLTGSSVRRGKEAWRSVAGAFGDDPDLKKIVRNAYRRRGRPITERLSSKGTD